MRSILPIIVLISAVSASSPTILIVSPRRRACLSPIKCTSLADGVVWLLVVRVYPKDTAIVVVGELLTRRRGVGGCGSRGASIESRSPASLCARLIWWTSSSGKGVMRCRLSLDVIFGVGWCV
jgi:hypothetical protein